jgi:peptide/nickel transport system ATP-binding protein
MSGGRVVEVGPAAALLHHPATADTRRLLASAPSLAPRPVWLGASGAARRPGPVGHSGTATAAPRREPPGLGAPPLVSASGLVKEYPLPGVGTGPRSVRAVDGVDLSIDRGQTLALVGESGSGKSTTGRLILRLTTPTAGRIRFAGADVTHIGGAALRALRRRAQMVYQNPYASLDPRFSIAEIITEPLRAFRDGDRNSRRKRARELLDRVALPASTLHRRPAELSGGQRQRVAIARALALSPDLLVCDEPVSALDVSVQAQVLELLAQLQADDAVAYLFISHDLAVVRQIAHRVAVMRAGRVVEVGATADIFHHPTHPYTRELLAAIPGGRALPLAVERNPARPSNRHTCAGCSARSPPA